MIPRTTLAQKMDVLSSQANLAGYSAVIQAAARITKVLPMMMTPAGTISPCRVFVIGVGVAGLQAIATAKRLGARIEAFDTRPVVEEQVRSLGARFVKIDLGAEWTAMTSLPFVYAAWTGRTTAISPSDVRLLQDAQEEGVRSADVIAAEYGRGDAAATARAVAYLRDNVRYGIGPDDARGLQMFLDYAADLGLAPRKRSLEFF